MKSLSPQIFSLFLLLLSWIPLISSISRTPLKLPILLKRYRGGGIEDGNIRIFQNNRPLEKRTVWIASKFGSKYLDQKIKLEINQNMTIQELKQLIYLQFPENPPVTLQNLYFGLKSLDDRQPLYNITNSTIIPLQLDLVTSSPSNYLNIQNIEQALNAYVSLQVHQSFLNQQLNKVLSSSPSYISPTSTSTSLPQSLSSVEMFQILNRSIHNSHQSSIKKAQEMEGELPSLSSESNLNLKDSTSDSFDYSTIDEFLDSKPSLRRYLTTAFSFNRQIIRSLVFYSLVWIAHGLYETEIPLLGRITFFSIVPMIWLLQLRIVRYPLRILKIFLLTLFAKNSFLLPLLPAQYQVLAVSALPESQKIKKTSSILSRGWSRMSEWFQLKIIRYYLNRTPQQLNFNQLREQILRQGMESEEEGGEWGNDEFEQEMVDL